MRLYDYYIDLIIFFKTIFFILSLIHIYFKIKDNRSKTSDTTNNTNTNNTNTTNTTNTNTTNTNNTNNNNANNLTIEQHVEYLRSSCEFIVTALISLLLIYLFNPLYPKLYLIDKETKIVLFLFGIILLLTAKWNDFLRTDRLFALFQEFLR